MKLCQIMNHAFVSFIMVVRLGGDVSAFSTSSLRSRSQVDGTSRNQYLTRLSSIANGDNNSGSEDADDHLKYLQEKYLSGQQPEFPTFDTNRPSKSDVYDEEELANLLEFHQELYPQTVKKQEQSDPMDDFPSLHDFVLQAIEGIDAAEAEMDSTSAKEDDADNSYPWLTDSIREKISSITAIASDVDGTLIGSDQVVHPRTSAAVTKAIQDAMSPSGKLQYFFPATGKTRAGALNSLGPELGAFVSRCPGVFIQGLYCVHGDEVIFEKKLASPAIEACEKLVAEFGVSIIAYDGDDLYTTDLTQSVLDLHELYGEPLSKEIPSIVGHEAGIHKILVCDDDLDKLAEIRPKLEALAEGNSATVTQAVPTMLELLPEGCSKALGVEKLCEVLGIVPSEQLLSIGDAENDVGMLKMSSIGVCVGNGGDLAKDAADIVLEETNNEGGAGIAIEVLGGLTSA